MWTEKNRLRYDRSKQRYPSDLTDGEWTLVEPLIPPAKRGGRKREVNIREVINGIMYVLSAGCPWRYMPKDLPPKDTVYGYLDLWNYDGTLLRIHNTLYALCRKQAERKASPTVAIIDSQSVKSTEKGGANIDLHGYDAGKKINGKKRHIAVDTLGLILGAVVHPADIQDRDGGPLVLKEVHPRFPSIVKIIADGGYQGPKMAAAVAAINREWVIEIVKRPELKKFVVLPKRWIVERTIGWLNRCRRLAKDFENLTRNALAFLYLSSIRLMVRRLCNPC